MRRVCSCVASCPVLAAVLLAGAGARAGAQTVMGRVVEAYTRKVLAGVPVTLERVDSAEATGAAPPLARSVTAPDGAFALAAPGPGTYRVRLGVAYAGPWLTLATVDSVDQREYAITPVRADSAASTPEMVPGSFVVVYPKTLRGHPKAGRVLVEVAVDTSGVPDMHSLRVLTSDGPLFTDAVVKALAGARFMPAVVAGQKVRALARVPASFSVDRGSDTPWRDAVRGMTHDTTAQRRP